MKTLGSTLAILSILASGAVAQKPASDSALQSLVETEQAFSKTAEVQGTRDAFLLFIADDGILFRPTAVNGKQWMKDHPLPPSTTPQKRPLLAWQPIFADVARAGDLGYTTGPWEFKDDIKDEKPSGYGNFVTLWKRQPDGSWKFVVDLGISHSQSSGPLKLRRPASDGSQKQVGSINVSIERKTLVRRDLQFSDAALKSGFVKAFLVYAAHEVRLFRNDRFPFVGKQAATAALATGKGVLTWQPTGVDVSRSGDLGYTRGTYETKSDDSVSKVIESGSYVRIWKKQNGVWRIVVDITNPIPQE